LPTVVTPVDLNNQSSKFLGSGMGSSSSFMVTEFNQLYAWGSNVASSLGDGGTMDQKIQTLITLGATISSIHSTTSGSTTYAVTDAGQVYAWGSNADGLNFLIFNFFSKDNTEMVHMFQKIHLVLFLQVLIFL
jgi:alpha-tubulin suppressor-like RCC1 family protein